MSRREKSPRFRGLSPSSLLASRIKSRTRKKGTRAEIILRKALRGKGLHYRLHADDLPGKPDIVFRGKKVAIFVDGDFWHGRDWEDRQRKLARGSNPVYWLQKIAYNMERDKNNTELLTKMGWRVLRFWESDVLDRAPILAAQVHSLLADGQNWR